MSSTPSHLFQKGADPRRGTKPKGTRNKLAGQFFNDLYAVWDEQGEAVLRRAAFEKPMEFAAMVAKLMPAKLEISTPTHGLTDERFQELMDLAERQLALSASMTIEGSAVSLEGGGGSPQPADAPGEVIDLTSSSAPRVDALLAFEAEDHDRGWEADTVLVGPDFAAAPHATPSSLPAEAPNRSTGFPADPLADEDEIDIASLF